MGRNYIASIDTTTDTLNAWNPNASNTVRALARSGSSLYVGGDFAFMNSLSRIGFTVVDKDTAAVGATTLTVTAVYSIAVPGNGGVKNNANKTGFSVIDSVLASILF